MFRIFRPRKPPPLPLPFENTRERREKDRRKVVERIALREMDRTAGFSWNRPEEELSREQKLQRFLREKAPFAAVAVLCGGLIMGGFVLLSRTGLAQPGPTIIYIEDWSGRPDLDLKPDAARAPAPDVRPPEAERPEA
ncbi:MAG: hypothetical protein SNJ79_11550 [Sphingomonadaceae bacterium]